MAIISSHTLNSVDGTHAGGVGVRLFRLDAAGNRAQIFETATDEGGRLSETVDLTDADAGAEFELVFATGRYFASRQVPISGMVGLAYMYQDPDSGRFKPEKAAEFLLRAAFENDNEAQFELARAYEKGFGVPQDGVKALEWYERAAEHNFADAINELGFLHYSGGLGIRPNPDKALTFFQRAAKLGHEIAGKCRDGGANRNTGSDRYTVFPAVHLKTKPH